MVEIDATLVKQLIRTQFPQWAELPIAPVENGGWDNRTFRLGDGMSVRLPSAPHYVAQVEKEHRWLPVLRPQLPLQIPIPLARGAPGAGYLWPWSVYGWLDGTPAQADRIHNLGRFAEDLLAFWWHFAKSTPATDLLQALTTFTAEDRLPSTIRRHAERSSSLRTRSMLRRRPKFGTRH